MGPLILSNSLTKLEDPQRPGDNGAAWGTPVDETFPAPVQGRNATLDNQATSSTATNKHGKQSRTSFKGLCAQCVCCYQCGELCSFSKPFFIFPQSC